MYRNVIQVEIEVFYLIIDLLIQLPAQLDYTLSGIKNRMIFA